MKAAAVALALAVGTAGACAGAGSTPAQSARPSSGGTAPVRLAPDTAHYRVASHLAVEQEVGGQTQHSGLVLVYHLTVRIARQGDRLRATLVLDSVPTYSGSGAVDPTVSAVRGTVFQGTLAPTGELTELSGGDSSVRFVHELTTELKNFFPRVLAAGALPGQRWVDTTEQQATSSSVPLTIRFVGDHEVGEPGEHLNQPTLPVRSRIDYTFAGTGSQGGQEFRVEGTGRRLVTEYLALDGRYLGLTAADSSTFTIALPAVGMTIPGRQARADTVTVVR
jgi:hypothetical protein